MTPTTNSRDEPRSSMLVPLDTAVRSGALDAGSGSSMLAAMHAAGGIAGASSDDALPFSSLTMLTHMQPHPLTLLPTQAHRSDDTHSATIPAAGSALTLLPPLLEPGTDDRTLLPLSVLRLAPVGAASAAPDTEIATSNKSSLFGALTHVPISAESTSLDIFFSMPGLDELPPDMDDAAIREAMQRSDVAMAGSGLGTESGMFGLGLGLEMGAAGGMGMDGFGSEGSGMMGLGGFGMGSMLPSLPSMGPQLGGADDNAASSSSLLQAVVPFDERRSLLARVQRNPMAHAQQQLQQQLQLTSAAAGESSTALVAPASHSALYAVPSEPDDESVSTGANLMGVGWRSAIDAESDDAVPAGWSDRFALPALLPGLGRPDEARRAASEAAAARREAQREREHIERIWGIMLSLQDPANRQRLEEAAEAEAEEKARAAAQRRVPRPHPSSVAFPSHPLPSLSRTPTFSQASWDSPALHRSIGEYDRLGSPLPLRQLSPCASSSDAFHQILHAVGPGAWTARELVVPEAEIVRQMLQILQAVGSTSFFRWDAARRMHLPRVQCLRLELCTPRALQQLLAPLLRMAGQVKLLWAFVRLFSAHEQRPFASAPLGTDADSFEEDDDDALQFDPGSVLHAFAAGVEEALQQYTIAILQLPATVRRRRRGEVDGPLSSAEAEAPLTLLELSAHLSPLTARIQYLSDLCETPRVLDEPASFLRGASLLDRLYELCVESSYDVTTSSGTAATTAVGSSAVVLSPCPNVVLLRGLFLRGLRAYMSLLLVWIHRGELRDPFGEFVIEWREASERQAGDEPGKRKIVLVPHRRADRNLPVFLRHLESDVIAMGHTVQLLQLYTPRKEDAVRPGPAVDPDASAKRHRARKSSMQLAEDDALAVRARKLQAQSDYALSLRAQIAEKDAALSKLAAQSRAEDAEHATPDPAAQAIIAAERARLLQALEAARSPHSITGGANPRLDWRTMRDQLSPIRAAKMLKIEEEQIAAMKQLMEGGASASTGTAATSSAVAADSGSDEKQQAPKTEELQPQRLNMNDDAADEEKKSPAAAIAIAPTAVDAVAAAPSTLVAPTAVLPSATVGLVPASITAAESSGAVRPPLVIPPLLLPSPPADEALIQVIVSPSGSVSASSSAAVAAFSSAAPAPSVALLSGSSLPADDLQLVAQASVVPLPDFDAVSVAGSDSEEEAYVFPGGAILSRNEDPLPYGLATDASSSTPLSPEQEGEEESSSVLLSPDAALRALDSLAEQLAAPSPAPLSVLLESTVVPSLLLHSSALAERGLAHFQSVHHFSMHLAVLRRYMLMQAGDMMDDFCARLWNQARRCESSGNMDAAISAAHAFEMLESCSKAHAPAFSTKAQSLHALAMRHLSFRLDPGTAADGGAGLKLSDLKSLRSLQLRYTVSFPLSLLLPSHTLSDYSNVWSFLLQMQRVHEELLGMWRHLQLNVTHAYSDEQSERDRQSATATERNDLCWRRVSCLTAHCLFLVCCCVFLCFLLRNLVCASTSVPCLICSAPRSGVVTSAWPPSPPPWPQTSPRCPCSARVFAPSTPPVRRCIISC